MIVYDLDTDNYVLGFERISLYIGLLKIAVRNSKTRILTQKSRFKIEANGKWSDTSIDSAKALSTAECATTQILVVGRLCLLTIQ